MKNYIIAVFALLLCASSFGQALYRKYPSDVLGTERNIKVLKPRNYSENPEKTYPLIIVLDGDYLFEPVAGNVDYLSYWDQMPESFVLGINQRESRYDETAIDADSGFPEQQSLEFMDFVMEVVQTMKDEYRIAPFTIIVGKDITANLASFYLMRRQVPFNAFINLNPRYSDLIAQNIIQKLNEAAEHQYYYVASYNENKSPQSIFNKETDSILSQRGNQHFKYELLEANKYTLITHALPKAFDFIFKEYQLLDTGELIANVGAIDNTTTATEENPAPVNASKSIEELVKKYAFIKEVYGIEMQVRLVDIVTVANYLIQRKDYDSLIDLAQIAIDEYPELLYGKFIEGVGYEGIGRIPRAIKSYNDAYALAPAVGITKEDILDKVELLQEQE